MKRTINVVGAIIENDTNEVLCALRSKNMSLPMMWEFPGGKVEKEETLSDTIIREIKEELDCTIKCISVFNNTEYEDEDIIVNLTTVRCEIIKGSPKASEHAKIIWLPIEYLDTIVWAPADIPAVKLLMKR